MESNSDISGLDDLEKQIDDAYYGGLSKIEGDATRNARIQGKYQDHTRNLRNGNGGCLIRDAL
jgi:hypothetical protein